MHQELPGLCSAPPVPCLHGQFQHPRQEANLCRLHTNLLTGVTPQGRAQCENCLANSFSSYQAAECPSACKPGGNIPVIADDTGFGPPHQQDNSIAYMVPEVTAEVAAFLPPTDEQIGDAGMVAPIEERTGDDAVPQEINDTASLIMHACGRAHSWQRGTL